MSTQADYNAHASFWNKTGARILGDIKQRPLAVEYFGDVRSKRIIEAGCGTGYVARMLADKGASVVGVDNSREMLLAAQRFEDLDGNKRGIFYHYKDVTSLANIDGFYIDDSDGVSFVGVLMHLNRTEMQDALDSANYVLNDGGVVVVSVPHPVLYYPHSPARDDKPFFVKMHEGERTENGNQFTYDLFDIEGKAFQAQVYAHSVEDYVSSAIKAGFRIEGMRDILIEREHLLHSSWGDRAGFPSHWQMRLVKEEER